MTTRILHIFFKILQIDFLLSIDNHIELLWLEHREQIRRDYFVDSVSDIFDEFDHAFGTVVFAPG